MSQLTVNLLGPFQALKDESPLAFRSDKERALLAYLAIEADRPHRREALTGLLYPEQEQTQAQNNLRKTLHRLRAALGQTDDSGTLLITPKTVQFNAAAPHVLDVSAFRARIERTRQHKHRRAETCAVCARELENAVGLYRGEFLAGFNRSGSDTFEEWSVITREQLHHQAVSALGQLLSFYLHRNDWNTAIVRARRLLELETWSETAHRALMTALAAQGQRTAALTQFTVCEKILRDQFDAEPERETRALAQAIRDSTFTTPHLPETNLQPALTPFIGREREIRILSERLLDPTLRLHSIVGPGGMGKTRLAQTVAEQVRLDFRDGAYFIPLASVNPNTTRLHDALATATADALGMTFSGTNTPSEQLFNLLRRKELLLVLDNMEHLMSAADWVVELLQRAPRIEILITTREPLNVSAETILRLEGLALPEAQEHEEEAGESVRLFIERAARAAGQFNPTQDNLRMAARICRRVEGMPLAIELAAAWHRTRTLQEIADQLDAAPDSLATTQRDVQERHRSLRAIWEGSWEMLDENLQSILAQASIFQGGFTQNAAIYIINAQNIDLDILTDKSLLKRTENNKYILHELLREFTKNKLSSIYFTNQSTSDNYIKLEKELKKRYSEYYLEYMAKRGQALLSGDPRQPLAELRQELDNFRAAWQIAIEHAIPLSEQNLRGIFQFYYLTGMYREGLGLIEQLRTLHPDASSQHDDIALEASLVRAEFLERLAQYNSAMQELERLLNQTPQAPAFTARAHLRAAWICYWTGKLEQGRVHIQHTLQAAPADPLLQADTLYVAGLIEQSAADVTHARDYYERALELYRAQTNQYGECSALVNLADIAVDTTALDDALRYGEQALQLSNRIGKRFDQAASNVILGSLMSALGDNTRAAPYYAESLRLFREMGNGTGESIALRDYALLHLHIGDARAAYALAEQAARVAQDLGSQYREGLARIISGDTLVTLNELVRAEQNYLRAIELLQHAERGHLALDALAGLVRIALARDDKTLALERTNEILSRFDAQTFYDSNDPAAVYVLCVRVLAAHHDPRADSILARGLAELEQRAARIHDNALRQIFLDQPPSHRALRALATEPNKKAPI